MGCASALGLGMALGDTDLKVIVLDGDGAVLMRPGAMATIGSVQPSNLIHICFNNGLYDTTGGQATGCWNTSFGDLASKSSQFTLILSLVCGTIVQTRCPSG